MLAGDQAGAALIGEVVPQPAERRRRCGCGSRPGTRCGRRDQISQAGKPLTAAAGPKSITAALRPIVARLPIVAIGESGPLRPAEDDGRRHIGPAAWRPARRRGALGRPSPAALAVSPIAKISSWPATRRSALDEDAAGAVVLGAEPFGGGRGLDAGRPDDRCGRRSARRRSGHGPAPMSRDRRAEADLDAELLERLRFALAESVSGKAASRRGRRLRPG